MKHKKHQKKISRFLNWLEHQEQFAISLYTIKWLVISLIVGALVGSASALFLASLSWATDWREDNIWIIALLPLGGFLIGATYYYWGRDVEAGNNILIDELHESKSIIPFKMAPLVFFGTVATHFFGGSAGREGTAVQMGGAIADQFTRLFGLNDEERRILLITGVSAGFSSVFGTPLAGAIFGLEFFLIGRLRYNAIFPAFMAAIIADFFTDPWWGVGHTHYIIPEIPSITLLNLLYAFLAGFFFGLTALVFSKSSHAIGRFFNNQFKYPPMKLVVGGMLVALSVWVLGTTKYIGLGIPTIGSAFEVSLPGYDFAIKLILTALTLGSGFKGGEVTPLFFIGATLGNALSTFIPLPMALLAGMGFVAVFSGAANTPLATTIMGIELFGLESGVYVGIACVVSYLFSGHSGIYGSQVIGSSKYLKLGKVEGKRISSIPEFKKALMRDKTR
jgi:H+/Cl- antiporter ClcA